MALREIRKIGDELLRKKSRKIENIDERVKTLLEDMVETLHHDPNGIGLAAPQVGVLKRAVVIDIGNEYGVLKIINPEIVNAEGETTAQEGCLSIPGRNGDVARPKSLTLKGLNENGEEIEIKAEDIFARVICHEVDHLDGILFVDKIIEKEQVD